MTRERHNNRYNGRGRGRQNRNQEKASSIQYDVHSEDESEIDEDNERDFRMDNNNDDGESSSYISAEDETSSSFVDEVSDQQIDDTSSSFTENDGSGSYSVPIHGEDNDETESEIDIVSDSQEDDSYQEKRTPIHDSSDAQKSLLGGRAVSDSESSYTETHSHTERSRDHSQKSFGAGSNSSYGAGSFSQGSFDWGGAYGVADDEKASKVNNDDKQPFSDHSSSSSSSSSEDSKENGDDFDENAFLSQRSNSQEPQGYQSFPSPASFQDDLFAQQSPDQSDSFNAFSGSPFPQNEAASQFTPSIANDGGKNYTDKRGPLTGRTASPASAFGTNLFRRVGEFLPKRLQAQHKSNDNNDDDDVDSSIPNSSISTSGGVLGAQKELASGDETKEAKKMKGEKPIPSQENQDGYEGSETSDDESNEEENTGEDHFDEEEPSISSFPSSFPSLSSVQSPPSSTDNDIEESVSKSLDSKGSNASNPLLGNESKLSWNAFGGVEQGGSKGSSDNDGSKGSLLGDSKENMVSKPKIDEKSEEYAFNSSFGALDASFGTTKSLELDEKTSNADTSATPENDAYSEPMSQVDRNIAELHNLLSKNDESSSSSLEEDYYSPGSDMNEIQRYSNSSQQSYSTDSTYSSADSLSKTLKEEDDGSSFYSSGDSAILGEDSGKSLDSSDEESEPAENESWKLNFEHTIPEGNESESSSYHSSEFSRSLREDSRKSKSESFEHPKYPEAQEESQQLNFDDSEHKANRSDSSSYHSSELSRSLRQASKESLDFSFENSNRGQDETKEEELTLNLEKSKHSDSEHSDTEYNDSQLLARGKNADSTSFHRSELSRALRDDSRHHTSDKIEDYETKLHELEAAEKEAEATQSGMDSSDYSGSQSFEDNSWRHSTKEIKRVTEASRSTIDDSDYSGFQSFEADSWRPESKDTKMDIGASYSTGTASDYSGYRSFEDESYRLDSSKRSCLESVKEKTDDAYSAIDDSDYSGFRSFEDDSWCIDGSKRRDESWRIDSSKRSNLESLKEDVELSSTNEPPSDDEESSNAYFENCTERSQQKTPDSGPVDVRNTKVDEELPNSEKVDDLHHLSFAHLDDPGDDESIYESDESDVEESSKEGGNASSDVGTSASGLDSSEFSRSLRINALNPTLEDAEASNYQSESETYHSENSGVSNSEPIQDQEDEVLNPSSAALEDAEASSYQSESETYHSENSGVSNSESKHDQEDELLNPSSSEAPPVLEDAEASSYQSESETYHSENSGVSNSESKHDQEDGVLSPSSAALEGMASPSSAFGTNLFRRVGGFFPKRLQAQHKSNNNNNNDDDMDSSIPNKHDQEDEVLNPSSAALDDAEASSYQSESETYHSENSGVSNSESKHDQEDGVLSPSSAALEGMASPSSAFGTNLFRRVGGFFPKRLQAQHKSNNNNDDDDDMDSSIPNKHDQEDEVLNPSSAALEDAEASSYKSESETYHSKNSGVSNSKPIQDQEDEVLNPSISEAPPALEGAESSSYQSESETYHSENSGVSNSEPKHDQEDGVLSPSSAALEGAEASSYQSESETYHSENSGVSNSEPIQDQEDDVLNPSSAALDDAEASSYQSESETYHSENSGVSYSEPKHDQEDGVLSPSSAALEGAEASSYQSESETYHSENSGVSNSESKHDQEDELLNPSSSEAPPVLEDAEVSSYQSESETYHSENSGVSYSEPINDKKYEVLNPSISEAHSESMKDQEDGSWESKPENSEVSTSNSINDQRDESWKSAIKQRSGHSWISAPSDTETSMPDLPKSFFNESWNSFPKNSDASKLESPKKKLNEPLSPSSERSETSRKESPKEKLDQSSSSSSKRSEASRNESPKENLDESWSSSSKRSEASWQKSPKENLNESWKSSSVDSSASKTEIPKDESWSSAFHNSKSSRSDLLERTSESFDSPTTHKSTAEESQNFSSRSESMRDKSEKSSISALDNSESSRSKSIKEATGDFSQASLESVENSKANIEEDSASEPNMDVEVNNEPHQGSFDNSDKSGSSESFAEGSYSFSTNSETDKNDGDRIAPITNETDSSNQKSKSDLKNTQESVIVNSMDGKNEVNEGSEVSMMIGDIFEKSNSYFEDSNKRDDSSNIETSVKEETTIDTIPETESDSKTTESNFQVEEKKDDTTEAKKEKKVRSLKEKIKEKKRRKKRRKERRRIQKEAKSDALLVFEANVNETILALEDRPESSEDNIDSSANRLLHGFDALLGIFLQLSDELELIATFSGFTGKDSTSTVHINALTTVLEFADTFEQLFSDLKPIILDSFDEEPDEYMDDLLDRLDALIDLVCETTHKVGEKQEWNCRTETTFATLLELIEHDSLDLRCYFDDVDTIDPGISESLQEAWSATGHIEELRALQNSKDPQLFRQICYEVMVSTDQWCPDTEVLIDICGINPEILNEEPPEDLIDDDELAPIPQAAEHILDKVNGEVLSRLDAFSSILRRILPPRAVTDEGLLDYFTSIRNATASPLGLSAANIVSISSVPESLDDPDSLGVSGVGKSTLAAMVAEHPDVRRHYIDGVAWVYLGDQKLNYNRYTQCLRELVSQLDFYDGIPLFAELLHTPGESLSKRRRREEGFMIYARDTIAGLLRGRSVLVILDDLWFEPDMDWFDFAPMSDESTHSLVDNCALVITTRCRSLLPAVDTVEIDMLDEVDAIDLLIQESGQLSHQLIAESKEARSVVRECANHPLAVKSVGRWLNLKHATAGAGRSVEEIHSEVLKSMGNILKGGDNSGTDMMYEILSTSLSPAINGGPTNIIKFCFAAFIMVFCDRRHISEFEMTEPSPIIPMDIAQLLFQTLLETYEVSLLKKGSLFYAQKKEAAVLIPEALSALGVLKVITYSEDEEEKTQEEEQKFLQVMHSIYHEYGVYLANEDITLKDFTRDAERHWNRALADAYLGRVREWDWDLKKASHTYALEMIVSHMIRGAMYAVAANLLTETSFIRGRLQSLGRENCTKRHIKDCEMLCEKLKERRHRELNLKPRKVMKKAYKALGRELTINAGKNIGDEERVQNVEVGRANYEIGFSLAENRCWDAAIAHWELSKTLLMSALGSVEVVAGILYNIGVAHTELNEYDEALAALKECLIIRATIHGGDHVLYAQTIQKIGDVLLNMCDYNEAMESYNWALDVMYKEPDHHYIEIGEILDNKGTIHYSKGEIDEALQCHQEALRSKQEDLGEDHPELAETYHRIGNCLSDQGNIDDAIVHFDEAITLKESDPDGGPERDADVLTLEGILNNLEGNQGEGLECYERSLQILVTKVPYRKEKIASLLHLIGCVYLMNGEQRKAMKLFEESLNARRKVLGFVHLDVASTLFNMAFLHQTRNRLDKALRCLEEALKIRQLRLPNSEKVAVTHEKIGSIAKGIGKSKKAQIAFEEALKIRKSIHGQQHEAVAAVLQELGDLMDDLGEYESAISFYVDALAIRRSRLGAGDTAVAETLYSMGYTLHNTDEPGRALVCFVEALSIRRHALGEESMEVGDTLNMMGFLKAKRGELDDALTLLWDALKIRKQQDDNIKVADTLKNIGSVHKDKEEFELAIECYEECLRIRRNDLGSEHEKVADILISMGDAYREIPLQIDEARNSYQEALDIKKQLLGDHDESVAVVLREIGAIEYRANHHDEALQCFSEFVKIRRDNGTDNDTDFVNGLLTIANIHKDDGNHEDAKVCWNEAYEVCRKRNLAETNQQLAQAMKHLIDEGKVVEQEDEDTTKKSLLGYVAEKLGIEKSDDDSIFQNTRKTIVGGIGRKGKGLML